MSYDLHLVRIPPGVNALDYARKAVNIEDPEGPDTINPGPPDSAKEGEKQALARALIAVDPELTVFPFDYPEIARFMEISVEEARVRHRHLELNGPDGGSGVQITLFDDTAAVTLPYWHGPERSAAVWEQVWRYLEVLERTGGFSIYDPQLEQILDLHRSLPNVLRGYGLTVESLQRGTPARSPAPSAPPWWKFWAR